MPVWNEAVCLSGHVVGGGQVSPDPAKIAAVKNFPIPESKRDVRSFPGLTGYYRKFIKNYAALAVALTDLMRKNAPSKVV